MSEALAVVGTLSSSGPGEALHWRRGSWGLGPTLHVGTHTGHWETPVHVAPSTRRSARATLVRAEAALSSPREAPRTLISRVSDKWLTGQSQPGQPQAALHVWERAREPGGLDAEERATRKTELQTENHLGRREG